MASLASQLALGIPSLSALMRLELQVSCYTHGGMFFIQGSPKPCFSLLSGKPLISESSPTPVLHAFKGWELVP